MKTDYHMKTEYRLTVDAEDRPLRNYTKRDYAHAVKGWLDARRDHRLRENVLGRSIRCDIYIELRTVSPWGPLHASVVDDLIATERGGE